VSDSTRTRTPSIGMGSALLDAAAALLEESGPDALSVRRIAAAAGVAPMGIYNHFESKSGIIEALFVQGFERLRAALVSLEAIEDPLEALLEGGRCYRALALAHPMAYQLMFLRAVPDFEPSDEAIESAARAFDGLAAVVARGMRSGQIAEGGPSHLGQHPRLGVPRAVRDRLRRGPGCRGGATVRHPARRPGPRPLTTGPTAAPTSSSEEGGDQQDLGAVVGHVHGELS
jgi:AcrR family transcriptional regulator